MAQISITIQLADGEKMQDALKQLQARRTGDLPARIDPISLHRLDSTRAPVFVEEPFTPKSVDPEMKKVITEDTQEPAPADEWTPVPPPPVDEVDDEKDEGGDLPPPTTPWDERIHSSSKARNLDGSWKKRRGVDQKLFDQVTLELERAVSAGTSAPPPPSSAVAPPPPPSAPSGWTWVNFLRASTDGMIKKHFTADQRTEALRSVGLEPDQFALLATRPDDLAVIAQILSLEMPSE